MLVVPKEGIEITNGFSLQFPTFKEFFSVHDDNHDNENMYDNSYEVIDSSLIIARNKAIRDSIILSLRKLQYPNNDKSVLYSFFRSLGTARSSSKIVRVLHYGDSQIEGDRFTSYLRYVLQKRFGGRGPGILPAYHFIPTSSIKQENSNEWYRYALFGKKDTLVKHNRYGILASFSRFTPILDTIDLLSQEPKSAWVKFKPYSYSYSNTKTYSKAKLFYSYNKYPFRVWVYDEYDLIDSKTVDISNSLNTLVWNFKTTPKNLKFEFEGKDSPDIYGISLESNNGVIVDNIAMRGSSGTLFSRINRSLLRTSYNQSNIRLIILQFGGNVLPYLKTRDNIVKYAKRFKRQITIIQQLVPKSSIIVIGPSDMSIKEKGKYLSYPLISELVKSLKEVAFERGCAYWDIYGAMGGINSMPEWVNSNPPLASKDYIHFTRSGIKKISMWFSESLMNDYEEYRNQ